MTTTSPPPSSAPTPRRLGSPLDRVRRLGGLGALGLRTVAVIARAPFVWLGELPAALAGALAAAAAPAACIVAAFAISTPGVQLGNFLASNGQVDRLGGYLLTTGLRWIGPAVAVLALALSAGGRLTARLSEVDLGAEEGEAPGHDVVARLVAPNVVAFGLAAVALALLALPLGTAAAVLVTAVVFDVPFEVLGSSVFANARFADLVAAVVKAGLSGGLIGLVCCFAGIEAAGTRSPRQRARAVRRALLGSLLVVAFVNLTLSTYVLTAFPDLRFTR
jgi:phospholipid/cholesterol/gamma-HCH transport system permease protein